MLDALAGIKSLSGKGAGMITIPGLLKIEKKKVEAKPAPVRMFPILSTRANSATTRRNLQARRSRSAP